MGCRGANQRGRSAASKNKLQNDKKKSCPHRARKRFGGSSRRDLPSGNTQDGNSFIPTPSGETSLGVPQRQTLPFSSACTAHSHSKNDYYIHFTGESLPLEAMVQPIFSLPSPSSVPRYTPSHTFFPWRLDYVLVD